MENKPILNIDRAHLYPNCAIITIKGEGNYRISSDAWKILSLCNGKNDIESIIKKTQKYYDVKGHSIKKMMQKAELFDIISFNNTAIKEFKITGSKEIPYPQAVSIELTKNCNLKCCYCYGGYKPSEKPKYLSMENIKSLFKELAEIGTSTIELTGGEPLTHPNFKDILLLASTTFEKVNLLSNGVLFDDTIYDIIKKYINKIYFQISIDGATENISREVRGTKNTCQKSLKTIRTLQDLKCHYRIPYMITKTNICEMKSICEIFTQYGLKNLIFSQVSQFGRACDSKICGFTRNDSDNLFERAGKLYDLYPNIFYKLPNKNIQNENCGAGWQEMTISANGDVNSCLLFNGYESFGNIKEKTIREICKSEKVAFFSNLHIDLSNKECQSCKYKEYCGKCIVRIYAANIKRIKEGNEICKIAKEKEMDKYFNFKSSFKFNL